MTHVRKAPVLQFGGGGLIEEVEPNDTTATPQPLTTPARVRGNLYRAPFVTGVFDQDVYSFTALAGDRVYAALMTAASGGDIDTVLDIVDVNGTTILETDDEDGALAGNASNVGGTLLATGGTYFAIVRAFNPTGLFDTVRPYDFYVHVVTGAPGTEAEPNNNGQTPNPLPASGWISGAIGVAGDNDTFSFTARAGDTIVAILDGDPERDAPEWNPRLAIGIFNNFFLLISGNLIGEANPSEAHFMTARNTGTHVIYVDEGSNPPQGGATFTYNLAVFVIPGTTRTCTNYPGTGGPIADQPATTNFTINVPDANIVDYLKLNLSASMTPNTAAGDFDITLLSPDGNEVFMEDDLGGANPANAAPPQFLTTIEDEAALPIGVFGIANGAIFAPEINGRMDYFKGMQAQGTWTLRIRDDLAPNAGTLNSWSIDVCTTPRPACIIPGPVEAPILVTDFEAGDAGFTHSGTADEWERGLPAFAPITTAHSGTNAWKTDLDNTYDIDSNTNLLSPNLDLTAATGRVTLSWWHKFQMESASFDSYWVEVQEVGLPATARRVFNWMGATQTRTVGNPAVAVQQSAGWGRVEADISDFAGSTVEVIFHVASDNLFNFAGVGVDDFSVTSCAVISGDGLANAAITVNDGQTTYFPGEQLTYTIMATNGGPHPVFGANVEDDFPTSLENVTWTCTASAGSTCNASGSGDIDELVNLLPSGTATFVATGTVATGTTGDLVNTATVAVPAGWNDPDTNNNSATDTNQLIAAASNALVVDDAGNDVLEAGETAIVAPAWTNSGGGAVALTGTLGNFTGPAGPTYTISDGDADYGTVNGGATASCADTGDCYSVNVTGTRPSTHWDSTADETIDPLGTLKTWTLHLGDSFTDVPRGSGFYRFIETMLHRGVTVGCAGDTYCPTQNTSREQISVFVLVAKEGAGYSPAACVAGSEIFTDVPFDSPFCRFIEELFRRQVISGCGPGTFCPQASATREQMSVIVLRTLDPTLNPPDCVAGSEIFNDVPASSPFCKWVEELFRRQVISGCGGGAFCPTNPVTREQMSVFLGVTFGLTLYGI